MICPNCGFEIEDNTELCPYCHVFVEQNVEQKEQQAGQTQSVWQSDVPKPMSPLSRKEFMRIPEMKALRNSFRTGIAVLYFCIIVSLIFNAIFMKSSFFVMCQLVLFGMALIIQFTYSRVCSIILLIVLGGDMIVGWLTTGRPTGYIAVINMVLLSSTLFQIHTKWKQYQDL